PYFSENTSTSNCLSTSKDKRTKVQAITMRLQDHRTVVIPLQLLGPAFSSLSNELLCEEAQRIQLQDIGEPEYHFLNPRCLQLCQLVADGSGTADEIAVDTVPRAEPV